MKYKCPICRKILKVADKDKKKRTNEPYFPFCSERCKLIDIGKWLEEDYGIPADNDRQTGENSQKPLL